MKSLARYFVPVMAVAMVGSTLAAPHANAQPNAAPLIVPELQQWVGGQGTFQQDAARPTTVAAPEAADLASRFVDDLTAYTGFPAQTTATTGSADIVLLIDEELSVTGAGELFNAEGYELVAGEDQVTITAHSEQGLYYGTRTLLQGLMQSEGRDQFPVGTAHDWPDYADRGFMLDVARRYFTPEFLRDYIKMMGWYKLNSFQIHLNDNQIPRPSTGWQDGYAAFRLASDNPELAGLAAEDGSYDRETWRSFEETAADNAVVITPEIDVPAHSLAFIQWRPELGLNGGDDDMLDLSKPETREMIKLIFGEFIDWFEGPVVHFGADEYSRSEAEEYRDFFNEMAEYIRSHGKKPAAWGSMTVMHGSAAGYDRDVLIGAWNNGWYGMASAEADGYEYINMNDSTLYVVPFANYYHGQGLNNQRLYDVWLPNRLDATDIVPAGGPNGARFAVWNDLVDADYTELDVDGLIEDSFPVISQKTWNAQTPTRTYAEFTAGVREIGRGPGLTTIGAVSQPGTVELSRNASVTASSSTPEGPAAALTDGSRTTRWVSTQKDPSFVVDLGASNTIASVDVAWAQPLPTSYHVEISDDGENWRAAAVHATGNSVEFAAMIGRYVRVSAKSEAGASAWEVVVNGPRPLTDGATATASGNEAPAFGPENTLDGNLRTRWSASYAMPTWLQIDLGVRRAMDQVQVHWEAAAAAAYTVLVSDDAVTWTEVGSRSAQSAGERVDQLEFDQVDARYVRINVTEKALSPYLSLYEVIIPAVEIDPQGDISAPAVTQLATTQVTAGVAATIRVGAQDDSTPLVHSATGLPAGLSINAQSGVISGTTNAVGDHEVTVLVTDAAGNVALMEFTISVQPKVGPSPSATPTVKPTVTPSASKSPTVKPTATTGTGTFVRTAPYTLAGRHTFNGRQWMTTCEPYSQTERCRTDIWATVVKVENGTFVRESGWAFNNLTYLPFMTREAWKGNPLGDAGSTNDGVFTSAGRQWRTECDTAATGRGACRSYTMTTVYAATAKPVGGYTFSQGNQWVFNNIVMFGGPEKR
ncbi:discoidin domain-containing protein [Tessaracoccus sp. MC1756]|uniref:discoidin domain-containing protein n=1 Tax=Tessaracoccus sp. MC1756 TaxID=2760311 RepID=UPI001C71909E